MEFVCVAPVQGCALRITRENECGVPLDPLTPNSRIQSQKFTTVESSPQNEDPNEIMLQTACSEITTYFRTPRRTKYHELTLTLAWVDLPILEMLLDVSLLAAPDDPAEFIGWAANNGLTAPNPNPKMLEVQAINSNAAECGLGGAGSRSVVRNVWPKTVNWALNDTLAINNSDAFTLSLVGDALNNPNWFPSFPGPTFPSWVPGGGSTSDENIPDGPAPAVLPGNVPADPFTLDDQEIIQAAGPYFSYAEGEWFETADFECRYVTQEAS